MINDPSLTDVLHIKRRFLYKSILSKLLYDVNDYSENFVLNENTDIK